MTLYQNYCICYDIKKLFILHLRSSFNSILLPACNLTSFRTFCTVNFLSASCWYYYQIFTGLIQNKNEKHPSMYCSCININIFLLSNFTIHYCIAERLAMTSPPCCTQTSLYLCVCAAASVVHLTRCPGQVWPPRFHCSVPFNSFLTGSATTGFKNPFAGQPESIVVS